MRRKVLRSQTLPAARRLQADGRADAPGRAAALTRQRHVSASARPDARQRGRLLALEPLQR